MNGDLPGVCAWCGEATQQFPPTSMNYRSKRVTLRLPDCGTHTKRSRWASVPLLLLIIAFILFLATGGIAMVIFGLVDPDAQPDSLMRVLGFIAGGAGLLGLLMLMSAVAGHALLLVRDIAEGRYFGAGRRRVRIAGLGPDSLTLIYVSPAFAEAKRVVRRGLLDPPR
jgi:hypothetical protein